MIGTFAAKTGLVGALGFIAKITSKFLTMQKNSSLSNFTSVLRVEPVTLIDKRLERAEYLTDISKTMLSLFSGYYLQAASVMGNVGQVNVMRMLDVLNPQRDGSMAAASVVDAINGANPSIGMLSMESYQGARLPRPGDALGLEDLGEVAFDRSTAGRFKELHGTTKAATGDKAFKAANEVNNLAVGNILEVTIDGGEGNKAIVPVSVRLATAYVDNDVLVHILGGSGHDNSFRERIHRWKAGDLQFVRDILLCQDMIDEQKRLMLKDKTGALQALVKRRANNAAAAATTGLPSIAGSSAIVILSKETATDLERANLGKLANEGFRQKIYAQALAMFIVVVDTDYETVTIYTRGVDLPSKYSIRELKASSKGTGPDVGEILKAYRLGMSPIH
ncbi:hypothetical protein LUCX_106 [Xanthomonas phage vB_XciM_LucasX]|nr:hypothetical protein LUCX_106 [Xanthomonas phage vB_XciM_LucasX]